MLRTPCALPAALALLAAACGPAATAPHATDQSSDVQYVVTTAGHGFSRIEGEKAGALFAALRPDEWNGSLVLLLHGQVHVNEPLQLPPPGHDPLWSQFIDRLMSDGYGVAFSSFRANGFAVHEGVTDTRVAQAMFTSAFGNPTARYLVGFSMGNHVGQKLVETSSASYDGFLAACSGIGGATLQWEYFINARILFDFYFPGVLAGNAWTVTDNELASVAPAVVAAITAGPEAFARAAELAGVDQLELPWTTPEELITAVVSSLLGAGGGTGDLQAKTGGIATDNIRTRYSGSSDDAALNEGVVRFAADPNAVRFMQRFDPTGQLRGPPVLALHTTRDPVVSHRLHFPAYRAVLAAKGNEELFATRLIDRSGHCAFTVDELMQALQHLVRWAATGTSP